MYHPPFILYSPAHDIDIGVGVFIPAIVIAFEIYAVAKFTSSTSVNEKLSGVVSGLIVVIE